MCDNVTELSDAQRRVLPFLLASPNITQACKKARITPKTVYAWLHESDAFRNELRRRRKAIADAALDGLKARIEKAVETLEALLGAERESVRRSAARDILDLSLRLRAEDELEERIARIEKMLEAKDA